MGMDYGNVILEYEPEPMTFACSAQIYLYCFNRELTLDEIESEIPDGCTELGSVTWDVECGESTVQSLNASRYQHS
jgi:hypothetical protein